jgi:hypothetical protein
MSPAEMTPTAWHQGAKNAAICGSCVVVLWGLLTAVVSLIVDRPLAPYIAVVVLGVGSLFAFFVHWLYSGFISGAVLVDCGLHPTWKLFLSQAAVFVILGLTAAVAIDPILGPLIGNAAAVYWLIMAGGRLQVRKNGLWQYHSLLRWSKIGSYAWAADGTLLITHRALLPSKGALPVPPEHRAAVDQFLRRHCGGDVVAR